jgi:hypothetical protein
MFIRLPWNSRTYVVMTDCQKSHPAIGTLGFQ